MKYLTILAMLFLTACSSTTKLEKTSGTIGYNTEPIRVLGTGKNVDEATVNALNIAIERVVGSVILSLRETNNNILYRDEIIKHSAGYIDDYKVISGTKDSVGNYTLVVDVKVKSSKIADRLLGKQGAVSDLQGNKVIGKYNSFLNEGATGDKFIETILESHLRDGYIVTPGRIDVHVDNKRNMLINIPYKVKMNQNWVKAYMEALSVVESGDNKSPHFVKVEYKINENDWLFKSKTFNFNDSVRYEKIATRIRIPFHLNVKVLDKNNKVILEKCGEERYQQGGNYFNGDFTVDTNYIIKVEANSQEHKDLQAMDRMIFRMSNCRHLRTHHRYLKDFVAD